MSQDLDPDAFLAELPAAWRSTVEADARMFAWLRESRSDFRLTCVGHNHEAENPMSGPSAEGAWPLPTRRDTDPADTTASDEPAASYDDEEETDDALHD